MTEKIYQIFIIKSGVGKNNNFIGYFNIGKEAQYIGITWNWMHSMYPQWKNEVKNYSADKNLPYNRENKATLNIRRPRVLGEEKCQKHTILLSKSRV